MNIFDEIGADVERRWRRTNYHEAAFPAIASEVLETAALVRLVDPWEIVRWLFTTPFLPAQQDLDGHFGDLPITLFAGSRFHIDAYYWLDGTTTIHQHAFAGAFQVLLGSSVHSRYTFGDETVVSEHFSVGAITLNDVELLKQGDIRPILPGRPHIHSLFHLDRPSLTITVRTEHTPSAGAQYDYHRPFVAYDAFYRNEAMIKKVRSVALLLAMKHRDADSLIGEVVCSSDFHTAFLVLAETHRHLTRNRLETLFGMSTGRDRFAAILARARTVHGALVDVVEPVLVEQDRQRNIITRRHAITEEPHRFLLALLLNVPDKAMILDLVRSRVPDCDPVDTIVGWVAQLAQRAVFESHEENLLGIDGFDERHTIALRDALRGQAGSADAECVLALKASVLSVLM